MATKTQPLLGREGQSAVKPTSLAEVGFGILPIDTHPQLQQDVVKELVNKVAWVLGSTYRVPYSNTRSPARDYAWKIVRAVLRDNGYPRKIALTWPLEAD